ncbi:puromycin-sensitive aminopeptidase isoform X1 [Dermacentor variabilis]|uniref:puromycin-sensitive aminopeptidase isoform X1 n=2 Tax=Dermacentor variabilis TaxID=34621 RepID=UPI003F5B6BA8
MLVPSVRVPRCLGFVVSRYGTFLARSSVACRVHETSACRRFCQSLCTLRYTAMSGENRSDRLPANVRPVNYKIELKPDLKKLAFDGKIVVTVQIRKPSDVFVLNSLALDIKSAEYISDDGKEHKVSSIATSKEEERITIKFDTVLAPGTGKLGISYSGEMNGKLKGFYWVKYKGQNGEDKFGGVTHFEPTDARRAFPCWDEPALKASFDLTLVVPKGYTALSNTNVVADVDYPGDPMLHVITFARTPKMSTYLVAFVLGEYDYVEGTSDDGVLVRIYTPKGKSEQGNYALEVATRALPYYKNYFGVAYPLPKMDLIAVPDLAAAAMENWGLVTHRESALLVDEQNTSAERKQNIALVVTHEIAHQWFGNLVTMEWWTHLWLNEGFASFIEFLCVDHLFPKYHIWTQFVTNCYAQAMELDALQNSHPIEVPVRHPSEIDEIFDDISYHKGASVIRMLHNYIGDAKFREGMNLYLTKHKYGNTTTEDLWHCLGEVCQVPVEAIMNTWVKQKGYPVLSVTSYQDGDSRVLMFTQEKFNADGKATKDSSLWMVPISITSSKAPNTIIKQFLLDSASSVLVVDGVTYNDWVKINVGTVGCYRTMYSSRMLSQLIPAVQNKTLPPLDRLGLQSDLFALVQSGHKSTVDMLRLMEAYVEEDNYTVWNSINSCLGKLNQLLSHTDIQPLLHLYGRRLLASIFSKLGWDPKPDESHLATLLRSTVIDRLARFKDPDVLAEARKRLDAHIAGKAIIPADIRGAVYQAAASVADRKRYNEFLKLYRSTDLQEEKNRLSAALAGVTNQELIQATLEFALSDEVKSQDAVFVIIYCALTAVGRDLTWRFFENNKDAVRKRYGSGFLIARLVKCITENFATEEKALEIELFFSQNYFPGVERVVQQSLENIRLNAAWIARDSESVRQFLQKAASSSP